MKINVEQQVNDDLEKFKHETYNGKVEIPTGIKDLFKSAILSLAPQTHGITSSKLKALYSRKQKEFTNGELSDVIKLIVNTPFGKLYEGEDLVKALDKHIKFEKFLLCYNNHIDEFKNKLNQKKITLQSLAGTVNKPMRIIPSV